MSNLLRGVLHDIIAQVDDAIVSIITNIPAYELRIVVQFVMFGKIPPGRVEDSYIPSKGIISSHRNTFRLCYSMIPADTNNNLPYMFHFHLRNI